MHEFEIISKYFTRNVKNHQRFPLGVGDDAALIAVPKGFELATSIDTLVEATHFPSATQAGDLGHKSLAVSLSDLAAMGAEPAAVLLALTLPKADPNWLQNFSENFYALADRYNVELIGGNITKGPLSISTVTYGFVKAGKSLHRSNAQPGDDIWVTGTFGDAALALQMLQQNQLLPTGLHQRFFRPDPRVEAGLALTESANSAIDISDGLAADLSKILAASQVGADIFAGQIPLSDDMKSHCEKTKAIELALTGGEDYEICFTAPSTNKLFIEKISEKLSPPLHRIGSVTSASGLKIWDPTGKLIQLENLGFQHF
jgi:thiamine-monophosphate kinase